MDTKHGTNSGEVDNNHNHDREVDLESERAPSPHPGDSPISSPPPPPPQAPPPYSESDYVIFFPQSSSNSSSTTHTRRNNPKCHYFSLLLFLILGVPAATYIFLTVGGYEFEPGMDALGMVSLAAHLASGVYYCSRFGDEKVVRAVAFGWGALYSGFLFVCAMRIMEVWWDWDWYN